MRATLCFGASASHWNGFSCCGARTLGTWASVVVVQRLSCTLACLQTSDRTRDLCIGRGFLNAGPPGKSLLVIINPWEALLWESRIQSRINWAQKVRRRSERPAGSGGDSLRAQLGTVLPLPASVPMALEGSVLQSPVYLFVFYLRWSFSWEISPASQWVKHPATMGGQPLLQSQHRPRQRRGRGKWGAHSPQCSLASPGPLGMTVRGNDGGKNLKRKLRSGVGASACSGFWADPLAQDRQ